VSPDCLGSRAQGDELFRIGFRLQKLLASCGRNRTDAAMWINYFVCMLHEFLSFNREELIRRCRSKVSQRSSPSATPLELEHGVPRFLEQLVDALRHEQTNPAPEYNASSASPRQKAVSAEGTRTATSDGDELFDQGFTVGQVVHGYGDVCQIITELAIEKNAPVTVHEFRTFNRLLDNAIADAVSSYVGHRVMSANDQGAHDLHRQLGSLAEEQRKLVYTALNALDALKFGNIGLMGATGTVLEDSLIKLRDLIDRSLPEVRLATGMTKPPSQ